MSYDSESVLSGCLNRLDSLVEAVGRLQRAHALRVSNPTSERSHDEARLAKAAIEADYQVLKIKLTQVRDSLAQETSRPPPMRRPARAGKVLTS